MLNEIRNDVTPLTVYEHINEMCERNNLALARAVFPNVTDVNYKMTKKYWKVGEDHLTPASMDMKHHGKSDY